MTINYPPLNERVEGAKVAQVILVDFVRGHGTVASPIRRCIGIYHLDGTHITTVDAFPDEREVVP